MVKLTPGQQAEYLRSAPDVFAPASGAWGRNGCTLVTFQKVKESVVREALEMAWRNISTKRRGGK